MSPRSLLVSLAALLLWLPAAASAQDPCAVIKRGAPARAPGAPRPPLVIGDSSALLAVAPLVSLGIEADARGCRQIAPAVDILSARKHAGTLPRVDVLVVGANGTVSGDQLRRASRILGPRRILGLVTTPTPPSNAQAMRAYAAAHPTTTILIDWAASGIPQHYGGDGVHIGQQGETRLARYIHARVRPYVPPRHAIHFPTAASQVKECGTIHPRGHVLQVLVIKGSDRILCPRARELASSRHPAAIHNWNWFDWRFVGRPPWTDVFVRTDGRVIVAARRRAPTRAAGTRRRER